MHRRTVQKKVLNGPDNHDGMVTYQEPDILECEVKWALGSITKNKAGGDDEIPAELLQILKDDAVKVLHSLCQQIWKSQQWPQDRKCQFSFQSQRRVIPKNIQMSDFSNAFSFQMLARSCSEAFKLGFSST